MSHYKYFDSYSYICIQNYIHIFLSEAWLLPNHIFFHICVQKYNHIFIFVFKKYNHIFFIFVFKKYNYFFIFVFKKYNNIFLIFVFKKYNYIFLIFVFKIINIILYSFFSYPYLKFSNIIIKNLFTTNTMNWMKNVSAWKKWI